MYSGDFKIKRSDLVSCVYSGDFVKADIQGIKDADDIAGRALSNHG